MAQTGVTVLPGAEKLPARIRELQERLLDILSNELRGELPVSEREDDLDALAAGINLLLDEMQVERSTAVARERAALEQARAELRAVEHQLVHSQKMEAIGRLAGGVAHDFNNLLSVMTICASSMRERASDDAVRDLSRDLLHAVERAAVLTRQLLAFSRQQPSAPKAISLNEIIASVDRMLRRLLGDDIELVTVLSVDLWPTLVDPGHLEQLFVNLAVNARDAMPEGGKLIAKTHNRVVTSRQSSRSSELAPGDYVELVVSDTGVGMSREVADRIFEPFFTTKEPGRGTGLGLSTCYGIVKQAGGHIEVVSEQNQGTTFTIYLPRAPGVSERRSSTPPASDTAYRGTECVLLVEDEPTVRRIAARSLERYGYRVLTASNASEAEVVFERHAADIRLLATDVVMPYKSGPQLAEELTSRNPDLRVLFLSGYIDRPLPEEGLGRVRPALLEKPFLPAALAARVRELLDATPE